jgi:hypothetical protein
MTPRSRALWLALSAVCSAACGSGSEGSHGAKKETATDLASSTPEVRCEATSMLDEGTHLIRYQIRNDTSATIHIVDSRIVPYELIREADFLVILHGIHDFNPRQTMRTFHAMVPVTRPVLPGETFAGHAVWPKRIMRDHYSGELTPASLLHGTIRVRCEVGWWATPITEANRASRSFYEVLDSQQLAGHGPINVTLP